MDAWGIGVPGRVSGIPPFHGHALDSSGVLFDVISPLRVGRTFSVVIVLSIRELLQACAIGIYPPDVGGVSASVADHGEEQGLLVRACGDCFDASIPEKHRL